MLAAVVEGPKLTYKDLREKSIAPMENKSTLKGNIFGTDA